MKFCKNCDYFRVISEPFGYEWGQARCDKYNRIVDFKNNGKINRLTCIAEDTSIPADSGNKREEFDAKVFLDLHNGGKTGTLVIKNKPPYDKGYFTGVSYDLVFNDPYFTATKKGDMK